MSRQPVRLLNGRTIRNFVEIKVKRIRIGLTKLLRERCFTDLARPREQHHFLLKIMLKVRLEVAIHLDISALLCGNVKINPQSDADLFIKLLGLHAFPNGRF
jgi:hypothetical protein